MNKLKWALGAAQRSFFRKYGMNINKDRIEIKFGDKNSNILMNMIYNLTEYEFNKINK